MTPKPLMLPQSLALPLLLNHEPLAAFLMLHSITLFRNTNFHAAKVAVLYLDVKSWIVFSCTHQRASEYCWEFRPSFGIIVQIQDTKPTIFLQHQHSFVSGVKFGADNGWSSPSLTELWACGCPKKLGLLFVFSLPCNAGKYCSIFP